MDLTQWIDPNRKACDTTQELNYEVINIEMIEYELLLPAIFLCIFKRIQLTK
jgi:hypothetical protein